MLAIRLTFCAVVVNLTSCSTNLLATAVPADIQSGTQNVGSADDHWNVVRRAPDVCPVGYVLLDGKCFQFVLQLSKSWQDAMRYCVSNRARLAVLKSKQTNEAVKAYLNANYVNETYITKSWWIGGADSELTPNVTWSGVRRPIDYFDWCNIEPNNPTTEHCINMKAKCQFRWNDAGCTNHFQFVCEYQPNTPYNFSAI